MEVDGSHRHAMGADGHRDRPHWALPRGWVVHIAVGPVPHFSSPTLSDSLTVVGTMQGITAVRAVSKRRPAQGCPAWARLTGRRSRPGSPPGQAPGARRRGGVPPAREDRDHGRTPATLGDAVGRDELPADEARHGGREDSRRSGP
jgi:hypothetical protein